MPTECFSLAWNWNWNCDWDWDWDWDTRRLGPKRTRGKAFVQAFDALLSEVPVSRRISSKIRWAAYRWRSHCSIVGGKKDPNVTTVRNEDGGHVDSYATWGMRKSMRSWLLRTKEDTTKGCKWCTNKSGRTLGGGHHHARAARGDDWVIRSMGGR